MTQVLNGGQPSRRRRRRRRKNSEHSKGIGKAGSADCSEVMWDGELTNGFQIVSLGWDLDRERIFSLR